MANVSNDTTSTSLNIQTCMTRTILIDLNPDEYSPRLRFFPFVVNLDRYYGRFDDPSGRTCASK